MGNYDSQIASILSLDYRKVNDVIANLPKDRTFVEEVLSYLPDTPSFVAFLYSVGQ